MKKEQKFDIRNLLEDIEVELMAWGAWGAHAYSFKYMRKDYNLLTEWMKKNDVDTMALESSYRDAVREFEAVSADKSRSFMKDSDAGYLKQLDNRFFNELTNATQAVAAML